MTTSLDADQTALLYRTIHITPPAGQPTSRGDRTELLWVHRYGNMVVVTVPRTDLGGGVYAGGFVTDATYVDDFVASAKFRYFIHKYLADSNDPGWQEADLTVFDKDDLTTLRALPHHRNRTQSIPPAEPR